jgi:hypothetical protein
VRGRRVDVGDPASVEATLDGVGVVMSCIDQPELLSSLLPKRPTGRTSHKK